MQTTTSTNSPRLPIHNTSSIEIRATATAGRGVFCTRDLPAGTALLDSADVATHTISREYRREVCCQCFAYNRGVHWKLKDAALGVVWCSEDCENQWRERYHDPTVLEAFMVVEKLIVSARGHRGDDLDIIMLEASSNTIPSETDVAKMWKQAEKTGELILAARRAEPCRSAVRAIRRSNAEPRTPAVLTYLLSAVLTASRSSTLWYSLTNLSAAARPYSSSTSLAQHTSAYLQLLSILPESLLEFCTPATLLTAVDRESHNSFGLRSLDDEGAEMFGYAVWPSASYWNHSCMPNVEKVRVGRNWHFRTAKDIRAGEEMCITYLGGDERKLSVGDRRKRLKDTWRFECVCAKCVEESRIG